MQPDDVNPAFSELIKSIGVSAISKACDCSPRAIYKWIERDALPRTDFTGETNYAERIAIASDGRFSADLIRKVGLPQKPSETAA